MLKIKDNVDLKELEKFGFVIGQFSYGEKYACYVFKNPLFNIAELYVLPSRNFILDILKAGQSIALDILFDLIKSDMVEKVE